MGALADIYSFIDSKKRAMSDAVKNPMDALSQALSKVIEDQDDRINLRDNAYPLPGFKTVLNTPEQISGFRDRVAEDDLNMAMAGMFVGPGSKTWNKAKAAKAQQMAEQGVDPRVIWPETGTWKGPDGAWRQEVADDLASIYEPSFRTLEVMQSGNPLKTNRVSDVLSHRKAYNAYPDLQDINLDLAFKGRGGAYAASTSWGDPESIALGNPGTSTAIHELQHAIQQREGWERGGSPDMFNQGKEAELARAALSFRREIDGLGIDKAADWSAKEHAVENLYRSLDAHDWLPSKEARELARDVYNNPNQQLQELVNFYGLDKRTSPFKPDEMYRRLAGEAEARATQARMNLTPEQRLALFPADSYDVPLDQLIVRKGDGGALTQMSIDPKAKQRLIDDLASGRSSGNYKLGDVTIGQDARLSGLFGGVPSGLDVTMTPSTHYHLVDARIKRQNYSPEDVGDFAERALERRARVDLDVSKSGQNPALLNPRIRDAKTGLYYDARMPMRQVDGGYEVRSIVPDGLPPRSKKPPTE